MAEDLVGFSPRKSNFCLSHTKSRSLASLRMTTASE
jgi:hypothetical protein